MPIIKNNKNYGTRVILLGEPPVPPVPPTPTDDYFYIEDISGSDNTLSIQKSDSDAPTIEVFVSTDQQNWYSMGTTSTTAITATVPANGKLFLKATTDCWGYNWQGGGDRISASGNFVVGGNILTLLAGDNFENFVMTGDNHNAFSYLFSGQTNLINANDLIVPDSALPTDCFHHTFSGCTSLTQAPALPATTLGEGCYAMFFENCTSLTTAPVLPATTLVDSCYVSMFDGCTYINTITTYATDISANDCIANWLNNVAATGDFYNLGGATYTADSGSGIPSGWTEHNSL